VNAQRTEKEKVQIARKEPVRGGRQETRSAGVQIRHIGARKCSNWLPSFVDHSWKEIKITIKEITRLRNEGRLKSASE